MGCHSVVEHLLAWYAYNPEFNSQHTHTQIIVIIIIMESMGYL